MLNETLNIFKNINRKIPPKKHLAQIATGGGSSIILPKVPEVDMNTMAKLNWSRYLILLFILMNNGEILYWAAKIFKKCQILKQFAK